MNPHGSTNRMSSLLIAVLMAVWAPAGQACSDDSNDNNQQEPSCTDGLLNGQETDQDCGGPDCDPCGLDAHCQDNDDCSSGYCKDGVCTEPFAFRANGGADATTIFDGKEFAPLGTYVTSGEAHDSDEALTGNYDIAGTPFPELYRTESWMDQNGSGATFTLPVPDGDYVVHLHFVDWAAFSQEPGDRVFDVALQGETVLTDFDIVAEAGKNTALVKSFPVTASGGQVTVTIIPKNGYPEIAGLEILSPGLPYLGQEPTSPPAPPTDITVTEVTRNSVSLSWTDNADNETSYEVQWRLAEETTFSTPMVLPAGTTTATIVGLTADSDYVVRVGARNSAGIEYGEEVTAQTEALPEIHCEQPEILCVDDDPGPFQEYSSIQDALDAASDGDTIYVREGTYREQLTITTDGITLSAVPGEEGMAVVLGSAPVTGWSLASPSELDDNPNADHIYVADSPCEGPVQRLFQDGVELLPSRMPGHDQTGEDRYFHVTWADSSQPKSHFQSDDISGLSEDYLVGARAHVRTAQWRIGAVRVQSSTTSGAVTLESDVSGYDIRNDWGFFFTQVVGRIDDRGKWAWRAGKLYVFSQSGPPNGIEAACADFGLAVTAPMQSLQIHGLAFSMQRGSGIVVEANEAQNVTITDSIVAYCGQTGIDVDQGGGQVQVIGNTITDCWKAGIRVRQTDAPIVQDNRIERIGATEYDDDVLTGGGYGQCMGILLIDGTGARITGNIIDRTAYNGIGVIDFGRGTDREIAYNHITKPMLGINDGAAIYFGVYGAEPDQWDDVHHNIVEDSIGSFLGTTTSSGYFPQGVGIYIDDYSANVNVHDNTATACAINFFFHDTENCRCRDNLSHAAVRRTLLLTNRAGTKGGEHVDCRGGNQANNEVTGNILFSTDSGITAYSLSRGPTCEILATSDSNIFFASQTGAQATIQERIVGGQTSDYDLAGWQAASGMDGSSSQAAVACESSNLLLTNPTTQAVTCTGLSGCLDVQGNTVGASIQLDAFESTILCGCSATPDCR